MHTANSAALPPEHLAELGDHPRRLVRLDAVHNFRDLGGYPTADGGSTRWGRLFRADGLYRLSDADRHTVRRLGLATVIDLRSQGELDERGRFPDHHDVAFHHLPVIDATWERRDDAHDLAAVEFLVMAYREMLDVGAPRFAAAFDTLARPGAMPAVFHCAAGKDRTGLLAAMVLTAVGVPRPVVLHDYGLTERAMARMRAWVEREMPDMAAAMSDVPAAFMAAAPEALGVVLGDLDRSHGSVQGYLAATGVSADAVDPLTHELVETVRSA